MDRRHPRRRGRLVGENVACYVRGVVMTRRHRGSQVGVGFLLSDLFPSRSCSWRGPARAVGRLSATWRSRPRRTRRSRPRRRPASGRCSRSIPATRTGSWGRSRETRHGWRSCARRRGPIRYRGRPRVRGGRRPDGAHGLPERRLRRSPAAPLLALRRPAVLARRHDTAAAPRAERRDRDPSAA